MGKAKGAATLIITSIVLVLALMVVMGSYKGLFYQIKRAQNEVQSRSEHWAAEGGLECAFAIIKYHATTHPVDQDYSTCTTASISITPNITGSTIYTLISSANGISLKKNISVSSRSFGAVQARSDLKVIGANEFIPDVEAPDKCVSVRYSNLFILNGSFKTLDPASGSCNEENKTDTGSSGYSCPVGDANCIKHGPWDYDLIMLEDDYSHRGDGKLVENDFVHDPNLDPFEGFFGDTRSNLASIKADYEVIAGTIVDNGSGDSCQDRIRNAYLVNDHVWVEGDCDFEDGGELSASEVGSDPKVLVIENGILTVNGANVFPGTIYHLFTAPITNDLSPRWTSQTSTYGDLSTAELTAAQLKKLTFFARGAFKPSGGYIFDTPGGMTVFGVALNLQFDSSSVPTGSMKVRWQRGSWNDL